MAGVNKVILLGRLGRDPETRNFQNGGKVVNLRLATSERFKDRDGQQQERTEWHSVAIFNERLGEVAEKYLRKGSEVYLEGQIETRKYVDSKTGQDRYSTEVVLRQFRGELALVGGKADGANVGNSNPRDREGGEPGRGFSGRARSDDGGGGGFGNRGAGGSTGFGGGGGFNKHAADLDDDIPFLAEWRA